MKSMNSLRYQEQGTSCACFELLSIVNDLHMYFYISQIPQKSMGLIGQV